jgi:hypothetical protein
MDCYIKFNRVPESGSGSRRAKMTYKNIKKLINFVFWRAGCSLFKAEGFSRSFSRVGHSFAYVAHFVFL